MYRRAEPDSRFGVLGKADMQEAYALNEDGKKACFSLADPGEEGPTAGRINNPKQFRRLRNETVSILQHRWDNDAGCPLLHSWSRRIESPEARSWGAAATLNAYDDDRAEDVIVPERDP